MTFDFFTIGLTLSLTVCGVGLGLRVWRWRRVHLPVVRPFQWIMSLLRDVIALLPVARTSRLRWVMHGCILLGFLGLLLFHAMDGIISVHLLPGYEPTLDPYQWLRNALGLLLLLGLGLAVWRRVRGGRLRAVTNRDDWFALGLLASIALSGFALEASKITSERVYTRMVQDYANTDDPKDLAGLRMVWEREYGVVFSQPLAMPQGASAEALYSLGKDLDEMVCASCHAPTATAFISFPLARAMAPVAAPLDAAGAVPFLWHLHVLCCFAGLLYLPWGKMAHVVFTPLQLVTATPAPGAAAGNAATGMAVQRNLGLDACTHCGACSEHCSVYASFAALDNKAVLPSEKLGLLRRARQGNLTPAQAFRFAEGNGLCTECGRCTDVCPARIDLQGLWLAAKQSRPPHALGVAVHPTATPPSPQEHMAELMASRTAGEWAAAFAPGAHSGVDSFPLHPPVPRLDALALTAQPETFWGCVQCTTCTNVCTVVAAAENPVAELDLMPQQIMNLVRMGMMDHALGARMVWSCVTCYKCQEHCPQGVRVADVLYELRNMAAARVRATIRATALGGQTVPGGRA